MKADATAIDSLSAFPHLNNQSILHNLKVELPTYLALAQDVSPYDTLTWWKGHSQELPYWSTAAQNVVLVQPSSASSERVFFSLLKSTFGPQQDYSLQDYVESSLMLQFNKTLLMFSLQCKACQYKLHHVFLRHNWSNVEA